jgi:PAS domain S-box-containing protein
MPDRAKPRGPSLLSGRSVLVIAAFTLLVVLLLGVAFSGVYALAGVRGYVLGEGLWSKAQKQAVINLHRYAATGENGHYQAFLTELEIPLGDRQAREELERPSPDMDVVRDGFRRGGLPDDAIGPMARLFRWGRNVDFVDHSIRTWAEADELIEELLQAGELLRREMQEPDPGSPRFHELLERISQIDEDLTVLEEEFSRTFNQGATRVERSLFVVLLFLSVGITLQGVLGGRYLLGQLRAREQALRASERRYRDLFERNVVGVVLASEEGRIVEANEAFARMMHEARPEALTERSLGKVLPLGDLGREHPLRHAHVQARRGDGSLVRLLISSVPVVDPVNGRPRLLLTASDITEQVRAHERLAAVVDTVEAGIMSVNRNGTVQLVNPAARRILGMASGEPFQWNGDDPPWELRTPEGLPLPPDRYPATEVFRTGAPVRDREVEVLRSDGSRVALMVNAAPLSGPDRLPDEVVISFRDVTDQRAASRARRMEAMGQLAGGVAHDFNNLLTVIVGNAQLLHADLAGGSAPRAEMQEAVHEILRTGETAARLTRQLLTFSRNLVLERRPLDLNQAVREARTLTGRLLPSSITCVVDLDPDLPPVEMSPTHLEQLLLNMMINARDAMPSGGTLTIRTGMVHLHREADARRLGLPLGRYATLQVEDTGHGMDTWVMSRIFEPFFTTKGQERGSGMGLATVYGVVTQAGGAVDVSSERGKGTVFTVYLPPASTSAADGGLSSGGAEAGLSAGAPEGGREEG